MIFTIATLLRTTTNSSALKCACTQQGAERSRAFRLFSSKLTRVLEEALLSNSHLPFSPRRPPSCFLITPSLLDPFVVPSPPRLPLSHRPPLRPSVLFPRERHGAIRPLDPSSVFACGVLR